MPDYSNVFEERMPQHNHQIVLLTARLGDNSQMCQKLSTLEISRIPCSKQVTAAEQKQLRGMWDPSMTYATVHSSHSSVSQRLKYFHSTCKRTWLHEAKWREAVFHLDWENAFEALTEECRALVFTLRRVNGIWKNWQYPNNRVKWRENTKFLKAKCQI